MNVWLSCTDLNLIHPHSCCPSCANDEEEGYPICEEEPLTKEGRFPKLNRPINLVLSHCCDGLRDKTLTRDMWAKMVRARRNRIREKIQEARPKPH